MNHFRRPAKRRRGRLVIGLGAVVLTAMFSSGGRAQLPPTPRAAPQATVSQPKLFVAQRALDLGKIIDGERAPLIWRLENRGDADLVIDRTQASCGCTVVQLKEEEKVIRAGGVLELKADFDSTRRKGEQIKTINVFSNDPLEPELKLEFKAQVETLFETEPGTDLINLRAVQRGQVAAQTFDVRPAEGRGQVEIISLEFGGPVPLTTKIEPLASGGAALGQRVYFRIAEDAPLGAIAATVMAKVRVDGIERGRNLMLRGEIVGDLTWTPKMVGDMRLPSLRGKKFAPVHIVSPNKLPFDILSASVGEPLIVSVEELPRAAKATEYDVTVSVKDDAASGPIGAMLEIRTSSLDQPVILVPVFAIVADYVEVDPPFVLLRQDGTPLGRQRRVKLQAASNQSLEVLEIKSDLPSVSAEVDHEASARYQHLRYVVVKLGGDLPQGRHETNLHIATTVPGAERLTVPVLVDVP